MGERGDVGGNGHPSGEELYAEKAAGQADFLKKENAAQILGQPCPSGEGRSIMSRFGSRQASRNYAKKLRRRARKTTADADYTTVTGDVTMVASPPAGEEVTSRTWLG